MGLHCGDCGCELKPWEYVYSWLTNGALRYICEDCFDSRLAALTRAERARLMGSEELRTEEIGK